MKKSVKKKSSKSVKSDSRLHFKNNKNPLKCNRSNSQLHFRNNKNPLNCNRSQSEVITTVLLILLVIVAIVIVWNIVLPMINKAKDSADVGLITTNLALINAKLYVTGGADVQVKRLAGEGNITAINFIFYDKNGDSHNVKKDKISLNELDTKTFSFSADELKFNNNDITTVSVVPMLGRNNGGEIKESESQIKKDVSGSRSLDAPSGTVSWWKFDGDYYDSVGSNHGSCPSSCPTKATDNKGNANAAYQFNGANQYIDIPASTSFDVQRLTISAWVYSDNFARQMFIFEKGNVNTQYSFFFEASNLMYFRTMGGVNDLAAAVTTTLGIQNNQWNHVVAVYDGTTKYIYANGQLKASQPYNSALVTGLGTAERIGAYGSTPPGVPAYFFNGKMDNVMVLNRALSASEVSALYNNQKA